MEELHGFIILPRVPGLPVPSTSSVFTLPGVPVPSTSGSTVPGVPVPSSVSALPGVPVPSTSSMLHSPMSSSECKWSVQVSKMLIDLYEKYRPKVGSFKIRNVKQMWVVIAEVLSEDLQMNISPNHCENRWRVLERNHKKYVDNKNATGRGRKYFDYAEEMDRIFAEKKTVNPVIVLKVTLSMCQLPWMRKMENYFRKKTTVNSMKQVK
ncbi:uncharacterized protein [Anabrus simplex]|uniref:uncharacterized protein n=1 Tax=Anabrus simplex TaxID=316456 RepID=UPI0035A2B511